MTVKELLKDKLTKKELEYVPSSFELIGNKEKAVAIIELHFKIKPKAKIIANALMKKHKNVKTVLLKESPRSGEFRIRKYKRIAGLKDTEVMHAENGCRFFVDPQTSYFSPRESTERMRIVEMVKEGENVMVFFAGIGPFAIEIAKKTKAKTVCGVEINPSAVEYFVKNIKLNKVSNVEPVLGNVSEKFKEFEHKYDRVLMPLPETAFDFIKEALICLKKDGICHLYFFENEDKLNSWKKRVRDAGKSLGLNVKIIHIQKVLPYGPGIFKWRMDAQII